MECDQTRPNSKLEIQFFLYSSSQNNQRTCDRIALNWIDSIQGLFVQFTFKRCLNKKQNKTKQKYAWKWWMSNHLWTNWRKTSYALYILSEYKSKIKVYHLKYLRCCSFTKTSDYHVQSHRKIVLICKPYDDANVCLIKGHFYVIFIGLRVY